MGGPTLTSQRTSIHESIRWTFGQFELIPARGRLSRDGTEVVLSPKTLEVLVHLVRHRDRIVSRLELRAKVWPDTSVSEAAVSSVIRDVRRVLGDTARSARFIATFRGRGLRFVYPVHEIQDLDATGGSSWGAIALHFERALQGLELVEASRGRNSDPSDLPEPRERRELMLALARARWSAGATDAARAAFMDAADLARDYGDSEAFARAALGFVGRSDVTPGVNREAVDLLSEALAALPRDDSSLRAELLARTGTELYYAKDSRRSERLTGQALAMAERLDDRAVLAYVLTARHFACQRPEVAPRVRIRLAERAIALTEATAPSDVLAFALQQRLIDLFELGDGQEFDETVGRFERVTTALDQPFFQWLVSLVRGTQVLLAGDVTGAEIAANATLELGLSVGSPNAEGAYAGQIFAVRREQGRLAELEPMFAAAAERHRALPVFRAGEAAVVSAGGGSSTARQVLDEIMCRDLDDFPRDQNWIAVLGTLAPIAAAAGDERRTCQLIALLRPYADRMIVVGQGATSHGSVSHHLGILHAALGEKAAARACFEDAEEIQDRAIAPLWNRHTVEAREAL